jgi:hypothetical protein
MRWKTASGGPMVRSDGSNISTAVFSRGSSGPTTFGARQFPPDAYPKYQISIKYPSNIHISLSLACICITQAGRKTETLIHLWASLVSPQKNQTRPAFGWHHGTWCTEFAGAVGD